MYSQTISLGELIDRITILRVKLNQLIGKRECQAVGARLNELIRQLGGCTTVQYEATHSEAIRKTAQQLNMLHAKLWRSENTIREAASSLSADGLQELDMDKWITAAHDRGQDDPAYVNLKRYLRASQDIRRLNAERHQLVRELDRLVGDVTEPKAYYERPKDESNASTSTGP